MSDDLDDSDLYTESDPPLICPMTGAYCVRAFCDDYGCANKLRVPIDEYDVECGSIHDDELILPLPKAKRKRRGARS
jgi:hypothetical protein